MTPCKNKDCRSNTLTNEGGCNYHVPETLTTCSIYKRLYMPKKKDLKKLYMGTVWDIKNYDLICEIIERIESLEENNDN